MLVLGFTSIAGASNTDKIVQLSVDGVVADEYFLDYSSDTVTLDVVLADGYAMDYMGLDLEIIGAATISLPDNPLDIIVAPFDFGHIVDGVTDKGIGDIVAGCFLVPSVEGKLVDNITLHYEGWGGVTVQLTIADINHITSPTDRHLDPAELGSIVVVPEPATIALLGLGSLALLRRRR